MGGDAEVGNLLGSLGTWAAPTPAPGSRFPSLGRLPFDFPPPLHIEMVQAPRALAPRDSQSGARRAGLPAVLTPSDGAEPPEWGDGDCRRP